MHNSSNTETVLRESEKRFKDIAMLLPAIICEWDENFKLGYINAKGMELFSLTKDQIEKGIYLFDVISPQDKTKAEKDIQNIFNGDFGNAVEYCVNGKDNRVLHILVNSAPILPQRGLRMCIVDITDRYEAQKKLLDSEKRFKSIVSWSPIGIALFDKNGQVNEMNQSFHKIFGMKKIADEIMYMPSLFAYVNISEANKLVLEQGQSIELETILHKNPEPSAQNADKQKDLLWNITPLEKGELLLVQVQDITEKKLAEQDRIQNVKREAEDARHQVANLRKEMMEQSTFNNMVGRSSAMKGIFTIVSQVATTPATVLVTGESGTGKELVARSLHEMSDRKSKPFIAVNCSALPDNLLESELFGYKAGAFTDAKKDKAGIFSRAHGGTIFLDEIGDISPAMQVKLLRVLQEKTFEPLGAMEQVKVDVRVIAATNKDLNALVKTQDFREDLLYRINVLVIKLPPLRDRRGDVPLLCDHFINKFNVRYNKIIEGMSKEAQDCLLSYEYPGNIRELENIIEHAFIFCKDPVIGSHHLPDHIKNVDQDRAIKTLATVKNFDELEKLFLLSVLAETHGSKIKAAEKLGIHKATLFRKLKKLGISSEDENSQN